jgi:hypothetical protein
MSDEAWPTVTKSDCVSWNINKNNTWQRGTWVTVHDKAWQREKRNQIRPGTEIIKNGGEEWQYVTKREKEWACVMKHKKKAKSDHCSHIFYYNSAKGFYLFYWYFFNIQMTSIIKKIKCIEESDSDVA